MINTIKKDLIDENYRLTKELEELDRKKRELNAILENVTSAKAYKLWQKLNKVKKPINILKFIKRRLKSVFSGYLMDMDLNRKPIGQEIKDVTTYIPDVYDLLQKKTVSVVIHTKNTPLTFETTLNLYRNQVGVKTTIIIVDSGSTDNTLSLAKKYGCEIYTIKPEEFKHGKTRNLGISKAKTQYIVNTVADAVPASKDMLFKCIHYLEKTKASAVSVRQIPYNDADYFAQWVMSNHSNYLFPDKKTDVLIKKPAGFETMTPTCQRRFCVLDDVFTLHKASVIQNYRYSMTIEYAEDLEYSRRLLEKNHKIAFMNSLGVIHSHNRTPKYFLKRYFVDTIGIYEIMQIFSGNYVFLDEGFTNKKIKLVNETIFNLYLGYSFRKHYRQMGLFSDIEQVMEKNILSRKNIKDEDMMYVKELMGDFAKTSTKINLDIIKRFDESLFFLIKEFTKYIRTTTDNNERINEIVSYTYDKLLCMNLGLSLGEIFIRANEKSISSKNLNILKKKLFYSV